MCDSVDIQVVIIRVCYSCADKDRTLNRKYVVVERLTEGGPVHPYLEIM